MTLRLIVALWLAAPLFAGASAHALSITGIAIAPTGSNTGNVLVNTGNNRVQVASSTAANTAGAGPVADVVGNSVSFDTRYAALVAADRQPNGGTTSQSATSAYTITFTVNNPTGGLYQIDIDSSRLGVLAVVNDGNGGATATLGALVGQLDSVAQAGLGMAAAIRNTTGTTAVTQNGTTVSVTGSALSQTYVLDFLWTATALSNTDEAAVRLGLTGGITAATADDYTGSAGGDGHFVNVDVTLLAVPEPATLALLFVGFAALAIRKRS